ASLSGGQATAAVESVPKTELEVKPADRRDRLLFGLLCWFKDEFFSWFEPQVCACGAQMALCGRRQVSPVQPDELAYHTEQYSCGRCDGSRAEFPRYNHPMKLLETRRGRCGEWANCFALCCRALGFETRFVEDSQDHVWTEVYSEAERRWLHCDPCERALDRPHIYEAGWKKKLDYVFAYACDEVADVTYRYSVDFAATGRRRHRYSEEHLARTLVEVCGWLQRQLPDLRRSQLAKRRVAELLQLLRPPAAVGAAAGRQSGSLAWRLARGEAHTAVAGFVFRPTEEERRARQINWSYSVTNDQYRRGTTVAAGWASCVHRAEDVQRKVERDWRMAYLCRTEGAARADVTWRLELAEARLRVERVRVRCAASQFQSGRARWTLSGGGRCVALAGDGAAATLTELAGCAELTLAARLDGGDGENAFQHAQLLRSSLDGPDAPLELTVWLAEAPEVGLAGADAAN
ncbi:peptide-N(4)-(N-acetyl-beta-glucosaminyl)asparagine amidase-like, partial [Pollicipes pollicipes]|uniref:peptide-N(4)-(N-acetyl-beta- glucosaminyl)asparagine amidase-like n=1 Tax=Pollicipes pollicipes TaxID=41117 RepID=UPI001884BB9A